MQSVTSNAVSKYINQWTLLSAPTSTSFTFSEDIDNFQEIKFLVRFNAIHYEYSVNKNMLESSTFHSKDFGAFHGGGYSAGQVALQVYSSVILKINANGLGGSYSRNWNDSNFIGAVYRIYGRR
jgi:hypothetical protein